MLTLTLKTRGSAFGDSQVDEAAECSRILSLVVEKLNKGDDAGLLKDINGNTCGEWKLKYHNETPF